MSNAPAPNNATPAPSASDSASPAKIVCFSLAQVWAGITILAVAFAAVFGFGYLRGKEAGTVEGQKDNVKLQGTVNRYEADLQITNERALRADARIKEFKDYNDSLNAQLVLRDQRLEQFSDALRQLSGCRFVQSQIAIIELRINSLNDSKRYVNIFFSNTADQEIKRLQMIDDEVKQLQARTIAFASQLGACH